MANCQVCVQLRAHVMATMSTRPIVVTMKPTRGPPISKTLTRRSGKWLLMDDGSQIHLKDVLNVRRA